MALARWQRTITDASGNILPGAQITVRHETGGAPLASLFSDRNGASALGNPFFADAAGLGAFHAAGGAYRIDVQSGSDTFTLRYVGIGLAQEMDAIVSGIAYNFSDEVTDADPTSGFMRFNNATYASITQLYVSDENASAIDVSGWLSTISDGTLTINDATGAGLLQVSVTGAAVDATTYWKIPVSVTTSSADASFVDGVSVGVATAGDGADGTNGVDGVSGGIAFTFDDGTDTTSDPGTGNVRLNNATIASVTEIGVDDQSSSSGNPDVSAWVATFADSTNSPTGQIILKKASAQQNFAIFDVTAVVDATTHHRITVTYVGGSGSFSDTDVLALAFTSSGDQGDQGIQGIQGDQGDQGIQGIQGDQGDQGIQGIQGDQGIQGIQGDQGDQGDQGIQGIQGVQGDAGADGTNGADGTDGVSSGVPFTFDSSTTTIGNPGTGNVRFNNGTLASVTEIGIDDQSAATGNPDISAWVATFADSTATNKGSLVVKKFSSPENFAIFNVTGITDSTTHNRVAVAHVDSAGSFSDTDEIVLEFYRTGDDGADGAGAGDVTGPGATTSANEIAVFDDSGGQAVSGGGVSITAVAISGGAEHDGFSDYVADEHINHASVSVTAGAGLTGGGDLTATRDFAVGAGTGITVNADDVAVDPSGVDHDALSNYVANRHVNHASVSVTAGAGLTGGGDLTATRDFAVGAGTGMTVNANDIAVNTNVRTAAIVVVIDGGGSAVTTGEKTELQIPFDCTITKATVLADAVGSVQVDIWKDTFANYPPTIADTITASAKPTLSSEDSSEDATLTGWTTSIVAGDTLKINIDSATTVQRVTLILEVLKT